MEIIQAKFIFDQLQYDLIGKDSYRGVTLTYSWIANQFGHIALGFIPTIILFQILRQYFKTSQLNLYAACIISGFWILFETYNFLGPLLKSSQIYNFKPDFVNVGFDTLTDLCFFSIGAFVAALSIEYSVKLVYANAFFFLLVIYPSIYWYTTKMYQQEAKFPFQHRLSQWKSELPDSSKVVINNFIDNNKAGKHLLVFGAYKSGKTSLSVAIANEESIKHKKSLYTSATKFYNLLNEPNPAQAEIKINSLWNWRNTDYLIIDDINPSISINGVNVEPQTWFNMLNNNTYSKENLEAIKQTNIIWVLGENNSNCCDWEQLLLSLGIQKENISLLALQ